jgi:translocation and assembly module TamB
LRAPSDPPSAEPEAGPPLRASRLPKLIVVLCLGLALILAALIGTTRYGVLLPQARLLIEARTDGLKIGGLGRLKLEGLSGDVWRDFRVRRLTIRDEQGVWLEARDLHLRWRYAELLVRRFHADTIEAGEVRLIRRPTLAPKGKSSGLPVSFFIDDARGRVEMLPAFSTRRGLYDLQMMLIVRRSGGERGVVRATSLLNPGDHLNLQFDIGRRRPLVLLADVVEVQGGALAGALGLPANQPFLLRATAGSRSPPPASPGPMRPGSVPRCGSAARGAGPGAASTSSTCRPGRRTSAFAPRARATSAAAGSGRPGSRCRPTRPR